MSSTVIYIAVCIISMFISFGITIVTWQRRKEPGALPYSIVAAGQTSWTFGLILETLGPTLEEKLFWDNFQFLGWMLASTMVVIFAREFTQQRKNIRPFWWVFAAVVTIGVVVLVYSDPTHKLIRSTTRLVEESGFVALTYDMFTPVMLGLSIYSYLVTLVAAGMLISYMLKMPSEQRPQVGYILAGLLLPILLGLATFDPDFPGFLRDISPFTFGLGNLLIVIGLTRYQLFEVSSSARDQVIETMQTAVVAVDMRNHLSFVNPVAMKTFRLDAELLGKQAPVFIQSWFEQTQKDPNNSATEHIIHFTADEKTISFVANMLTLNSARGHQIGRALILTDITLRLKTEQELSERTRLLEEQTLVIRQNTQALEESNQRALSRTSQLQALTEVSRAIASINELDVLLPTITRLISDHFGFYHVGIFLADDNNEYAQLKASNSEGGQRMLARGHRLKIGQAGMVGNVVATGTPRIALDTEADAVFLTNPELPNTRSETALPLRTGNRNIGALDIQSTEPNAFSNEDIEVLATLADQVSVAIENTRLFEEAIHSAAENQVLLQQYARTQWSNLVKAQGKIGYRYTGKVEELTSGIEVTPTETTAEVPIMVRGQVIGTVRVQSSDGKRFSEDEMDIIRAATERAAIAAENARLLEDSQKRAVKEQTIGQISSKISSSVNIENIMQTAVEELGRTLTSSQVSIRLKKSS